MKYTIGAALAAVLILSACGGGGGGGSAGAGGGDSMLQVSVTFPRQTLSLFQPTQVEPALSGFEGHTPACALVSGQIPPGMQMNGDCTIAGTPTVPGNYGFTLRVSAAGVSNTLDFLGSIGVAGPGIQYEPASIGRPVGAAVSSSPSLSWWPAPVAGGSWNYSVVSGTLAPGLVLDPVSGAISGTLTTQGTFTARIGATLTTPLGSYDAAPTTFTAAADVPTFSYRPGLTNASGDSLMFVGAISALQPSTDSLNTLGDFALVGGALPPGLSLDSATGVIVGYPTAVSGPTDFEVEATVTKSGVGTRVRAGGRYDIRLPGQDVYPNGTSVRVDATFNSITPVWVSDPAMTTPFSVTATFAPKPGGCTLPAGVTADAYGRVDGHPTETGTFQCTFTVTYAANGAQWTGEALLNLEVH